MSKLALAAMLLLAAAALPPGPLAQEDREPLESGLQEEVEVRFVILDALVLDRKGQVITGLTVDDFELHLDLEKHPIESVDMDCPAGADIEPKAVGYDKARMPPEGLRDVERRIVLAIDYKNLPQTRRVALLEDLEQLVRNSRAPGDELMVVAITHRLRVEQPFTGDMELVISTLDRMKNDPTLWMENAFLHEHEFSFFDAMIDLIRSMRDYEGRKAIVLFSNLPGETEDRSLRGPRVGIFRPFHYDRKFASIAAAATDARVAVYTVQASGLSRRRSSARLARMAVETGGRFTSNTNDLSLAYARAQRDLSCRYAVGFYDTNPKPDKLHRVNLKVKRPWARVIHPAHYRFDSDQAADRSLGESPSAAALSLGDDAVSAHLLSLRPVSSSEWEAAVVMRFKALIPAMDARIVTFGARMDDHGNNTVHAFDSSLTLEGGSSEEEMQVMVLEPACVAPGEYELSVVVNDPGAEEQLTATSEVVLQQPPKRGIYVVEPLLLQEAREGSAVHWSADFRPFDGVDENSAIAPIIKGEPVQPEAITAVTNICRMRGGKRDMPIAVKRSLLSSEGRVMLDLPATELEFRAGKSSSCKRVVDVLDIENLEPATYEFVVSAGVDGDGKPESRTSIITIAP
jgi:VWFA-related protein